MTFLTDLCAVLTLFGMATCVAGWISVVRFGRTPKQTPVDRPPVTILRPLCGNEPLLEEALESCCRLAYPDYQIVFGVQNPADPALAMVTRLRERHPDHDIAVVVDSTLHGGNRKAARHDIVVVCDSDLHLPTDYLDSLLVTLERPGTGLVTCVYAGLPAAESGLPAAMGATWITHTFLPGVMLSRSLGREDCLGSTVLMRRDILERAGGFAGVSDLLAEDNVLGQRVRKLGLNVRLADTVVAATVPEASWAALWEHEMRWSRTIRTLAPAAHVASALQFPLFWAGLAVLLSGAGGWPLVLFVTAWAVRALAAQGVEQGIRRYLGTTTLPSTALWLLPARDLLSVMEIAASFCIDEVVWRGHRMDAKTDHTA